MSRAPYAPRPPQTPSRRQARSHAYTLKLNGVDIWIPWHVVSRFLRFHVTIAKTDDSGQRWHTRFLPSALRWSGRNKRSFRAHNLKTSVFPRSTRVRP